MHRTVNVFYIGLTILTVSSLSKGQDSEPKVLVSQGLLQGRVVTSQATGKDFYSFQGVPYAKPPVNDLRFRDAVPAGPWYGTHDATKLGSECVQLNGDSSEGSEDCLYLNVYTPQLPSAQSSPLPVMFWIHGGGYVTGSASDEVYGPDFLVAEGVVVVTINYRLSCFGFLFLKDAAPGNVGLKDQVAALRWVNGNIAAFNGNPKRIILFGESAGAASVHWLTLTPLTEGLFQGAIAESASALAPWGLMDTPYETSKRLAKAVGCTEGNDTAVVQCLRKVDSSDLIKASMTQAPTQRDRDRLLLFPFVPTVEERRVRGVETFVTAPPAQLMKNGCQRDVPFLTGFNDAEWMLDVGPDQSLFSSKERLQKLDSDWKKYIYPETRLPENLSNRRIAQAMGDLRKFYLDGKDLTYDSLQGYKNMLIDLQFAEGIMYGAKYKAKLKKTPVYVYFFTVDDQLNFLKHTFNLTGPGAGHADELGYLFEVKSLPMVSADSPAGIARKRMVKMWTNFAKTGKPIPNKDTLLDADWKPYDDNNRNYLKIGENLKAGNGFYRNRSEFYKNFYTKYGSSGEKGNFCSPCSGLVTSIITFPICLFS